MANLSDIMEGIGDWDNFGCKNKWQVVGDRLAIEREDLPVLFVSLADLLANKSWTDALGLSEPQALMAFAKLRMDNQQEAIDYIYETKKETIRKH